LTNYQSLVIKTKLPKKKAIKKKPQEPGIVEHMPALRRLRQTAQVRGQPGLPSEVPTQKTVHYAEEQIKNNHQIPSLKQL
jgi:hypothetical protein